MRWARRRPNSDRRDQHIQALCGEAARPHPSEALSRLLSVLAIAVDRLPSLSTLVERPAPLYRSHYDQANREPLAPGPQLLSETALLVFVGSRVVQANSPGFALLETLGDWLAAESTKLGLTESLLRAPALYALPAGSVVLALETRGHDSGPLGILVREIVLGPDLDRFDTTVAQASGIRWLRAELRGLPHSADWSSSFSASLQTSAPNPLWVGRADLYDFTHILFHMTDWGFCTPPNSLDARRCAQVIRSTIAAQIADCDLDLLAELLLASAGPGTRWTPACAFGWTVLTTLWDEAGYLPCPGYVPAVQDELGGHDARCYWLRHHYHALWAAGLLCAALAARAPTPDDHRVGTGDKLTQDTLDPIEAPCWMDSAIASSWRDALRCAPIDESERAALVIEGGLIRAVRTCNIEEIHRLLQLADGNPGCFQPTLEDARCFVGRWDRQFPTSAST